MSERIETGSLELFPRGSAEFTDRCLALARSAKRGLIVHPWTDATRKLAARLSSEVPGLRLCAYRGENRAAGAVLKADWEEVDTVILDGASSELGADLLRLVDLPGLRVLAPRTDDYFKNKALFLISIPKSGTHLLIKLAEVMGFAPGLAHEEFPRPGQWYTIEYTNTHTVARDFFVDTVRRSPYGNRHHAFTTAPALFIYRHPLDILVSEANYYHRDGKTAFAGYLSGLTFEQRVLRLLDDPWLLGSIRDRIGGFVPWLGFPNVIPISFEELVGPDGGGSREDQIRLVWSLQMKLQVPGEPHVYASQLFDRDSPTFFRGRIGAWHSSLSEEHLARFRALNQDFMDLFGYGLESSAGDLSRRAAEFRRRPLVVMPPLLNATPITLEFNFLGFNLVRYTDWIYAVPQPAGPGFDLARQPEELLRLLPRDRSLPALKHRLQLTSILWGGNAQLMSEDLCAQLTGNTHRGTFKSWTGAVARGVLNRTARLLRALRGS